MSGWTYDRDNTIYAPMTNQITRTNQQFCRDSSACVVRFFLLSEIELEHQRKIKLHFAFFYFSEPTAASCCIGVEVCMKHSFRGKGGDEYDTRL